mgnify:CR=1 FL=1
MPCHNQKYTTEADLDIRINGKNICLDPCALSENHSRLACTKSRFLTIECCFKGLIITILYSQIDEIEEVIVKLRIVRDLGCSIFKARLPALLQRSFRRHPSWHLQLKEIQ